MEGEDLIKATNYVGQNYKLTPEEREVILVMDDKDRKWKASCSSPTYMRKFEKQGWKCVGIEYYRDGSVCTKSFTRLHKLHRSLSGKLNALNVKGTPMTEEHKKKLQEGRAAKKNFDSI